MIEVANYLLAFFGGALLASVLCIWRQQYELRVSVERFVERNHQRLKEIEKAFATSNEPIDEAS